MNVINRINFNDGYLELQKDNEGHLTMCACGELAHNYYHKFNKIPDSKLEKAFNMFNNCELVF